MRSMNVTQRTNMDKTGLTCFRHLLVKGHFWVKVNTQIFNGCLKLNRKASNRDRSNRLSQGSKRFGSGVVKGDGLWLGWVQMKTNIQKPVVDSLSAGFNWSNLSSQCWRVSTYIKLNQHIDGRTPCYFALTDQDLWHLQLVIWKEQKAVVQEQSPEAHLWVWWWKVRKTNQFSQRMSGLWGMNESKR